MYKSCVWKFLFSVLACGFINSNSARATGSEVSVDQAFAEAYANFTKIRSYSVKYVSNGPFGASTLVHEVVNQQKFYLEREALVPGNYPEFLSPLPDFHIFDGRQKIVANRNDTESLVYRENVSVDENRLLLDLYHWLTETYMSEHGVSPPFKNKDFLWQWDTWLIARREVFKEEYDGQNLFTIKLDAFAETDDSPENSYVRITFDQSLGFFPKEVAGFRNGILMGRVKAEGQWFLDAEGNKVAFPITLSREFGASPDLDLNYSLEIDRESVQINQPIDESQFTLEAIPPREILNMDDSNRRVAKLLASEAEAETAMSGWISYRARFIFFGLSSLAILVVVAVVVVWRRS